MSDSEGLATERTRLIVARRMDTLDVSAYTDEEDRIVSYDCVAAVGSVRLSQCMP